MKMLYLLAAALIIDKRINGLQCQINEMRA